MDECIFCKIVSGDIPSFKIYEDEDYLVFLDVYPRVKGHTLVIPKKHYRYVWDVEDIEGYYKICQKVAKHYQKVSGNPSVHSWVFGEAVPHAHVHIVPTEENGFPEKFFIMLDEIIPSINIKEKHAQSVLDKYKLED